MTLAEIKVLRDKYYNALADLDVNKTTHTVDGETQQHDQHRESLEALFQKYDLMYNQKLNAGRSYRLNVRPI